MAVAATLLCVLSACADSGITTQADYSDKQREETYKNGSLLSDKGGFAILGGDEKKADQNGIGVNGYLWRASLDTLSFMPIASADPFGGVILTDWYAAPNASNERIKLNVFILDRDLRADGVKVTVFRQILGEEGKWADAAISPTTASQLENAILTRARQLKMEGREEK
ncbi:MAG: DUF3576 domain-containing protein [Bdellovibrionales bacterium]